MNHPTTDSAIEPITPGAERRLRRMVSDGADGYSNRVMASVLAELDRFRGAFRRLSDAVDTACMFDAGETCPEDAPWAAALDQLDDVHNEIRTALGLAEGATS